MIIDTEVKSELATPKNWGFGKSKEKETPFFWMDFIFVDLKDNNDGEVTITKRWYITDKTIEYVLRDLAVLGWQGDDIYQCQPGNEGAHDFHGAMCRITTAWGTPWTDDKGEKHDKMEVKFINPVDYSPTLDDKDVKAINSKLRGKIAAFRAKSSTVVKKPNKATHDPVFAQKTEEFLSGK